MSKYAQFHLNAGVVDGRRLLREDLMSQYHSIQCAHPRQRTGYALGLWREAQSNTFSLYHAGGGRGFGAHSNENTFVTMALLDDGGRLVGMHGATREAHFLPAIGGQTGATQSRIPPGPTSPDGKSTPASTT